MSAKKYKILCVHGLGDHRKGAWKDVWKLATKQALSEAGAANFSVKFEFLEYDDYFFDNVDISAFDVAEAAISMGIGVLAEPFYRRRRGVFSWISDRFDKFSYDIERTAGYVVAWCANDDFQRETRAMLLDRVRDFKPDLVLAHSLGSLISYETFTHTDAQKGDVQETLSKARFVTFGSQVNNNFVRAHLANGYLTKPSVGMWHHLYNKHDKVFTAEILYGDRLGPGFKQSQTHFKDRTFDGAEISEHAAAGYLTHTQALRDLWGPIASSRGGAAKTARAGSSKKKSAKAQISKKKQKALLVGINDYSAPISPLEGCVNDVFLMSSVLQQCGFEPEGIRTVLNERATAKGILDRMEWLLEDAKSGDELIFYFSGHGARYPEYNAYDEPDRFIECLVTADFDWSRDRCIKDRDIVEIYSQLPYDCRFVMVVDACHSGGIHKDGNARVRGLAPPDDIRHRMLYWDRKKRMWDNRKFDKLQSEYTRSRTDEIEMFGPGGTSELLGRGSMLRTLSEKEFSSLKKKNPERALGAYLPLVLEACQADEYAYEYRHGATSYGAFTYNLASILEREKKISFESLVKKSEKELRNLGFAQRPNIVGPSGIKKANVPWLD